MLSALGLSALSESVTLFIILFMEIRRFLVKDGPSSVFFHPDQPCGSFNRDAASDSDYPIFCLNRETESASKVRYTLPLWLYVSVTGVLVYLLLLLQPLTQFIFFLPQDWRNRFLKPHPFTL